MIVIDPVIILLDLPVAIRQLTVQLTRDGEQTISPKAAMLLDPIGLVPMAAFNARDGFQSTQQFLASAVDGARLILATDEVAPRRAAARYPYVSEDVTFVIDLNDGSGGGGGVDGYTLRSGDRLLVIDAAGAVVGLTPTP